jgi:hypothetical protein
MVVPFDEVSFAIDLPSKEKAQPPRMLRAARHALRLSTPMRGFPRLGPVSGTDGAALPVLATDGLADEPNSHLALLKRLARELLKELRIEGVLSGVDVRIAVCASFLSPSEAFASMCWWLHHAVGVNRVAMALPELAIDGLADVAISQLMIGKWHLLGL